MKRRVISTSEDLITQQALDETGIKLIAPQVVLVVVRGMILAHSFPVAVTAAPVTINQDMKALRLIDGVDAFYFAWALDGLARGIIPTVVEEAAHGTRAIRMDQWGNLVVPLPPYPEQKAIAGFLDRETARIDALVARKERLIELLHEKRTALTTRAVTQGLNPNVPMKHSGIEWLSEIPAHWEILALGRVTISRCDGPFGSGLKSEHYSESGIRVVRLQNIGWADFLSSDAAYLDEAYARRLGDHGVKGQDILIAGLGDDGHPVGRACVAPVDIEPAMVKADCFRFRLDRQRLLPRYAAFQLSATASAVAGSHATGATRTRMNLAASTRRKIALPPQKEQQAIAIFLGGETAKIDALVARIHQAINQLREFRIALVGAAVTGKIDVRGSSCDIER